MNEGNFCPIKRQDFSHLEGDFWLEWRPTRETETERGRDVKGPSSFCWAVHD